MENTDLLEQKIADIVALNIKTAHVFKKYGIDFCCGGGITIQKACEKKNIDFNLILNDIKNIDEKVIQSQNYNNWEIDFLADFIVNTHHVYVTESLGLIDAYATKVAKVHGEHHPAADHARRAPGHRRGRARCVRAGAGGTRQPAADHGQRDRDAPFAVLDRRVLWRHCPQRLGRGGRCV